MNTLFTGTVLALLVSAVSFGSAQAQTYYPFFSGYEACAVVLRDLSIGMRANDVLTLQKFLVMQNYPGGGDWMLTGYFGKATEQAVKNFQGSQGLYASGVVDVVTRFAIARASCDGLIPANLYGVSAPPSYQTYPPYQYSYMYSYGGYGAQQAAVLYSLSPASGPTGSLVTVHGSGFSYQNNSVRFGRVLVTNLSSSDGRSLSFTVPQQGAGYGSQTIVPGTYDVSVTTSDGRQTNALSFTVTGYPYQYYQGAGPTISNVSGPAYLALGAQGTWSLSASDPWGGQYLSTAVRFGDEYLYGYGAPQTTSVQSSQTMTFTHAYSHRGTYTVTFTVTNMQGQQTSSTASVTVY